VVGRRRQKPTIWLFERRTPGAIAEGRGRSIVERGTPASQFHFSTPTLTPSHKGEGFRCANADSNHRRWRLPPVAMQPGSPPPCGEGLGVGVLMPVQNVDNQPGSTKRKRSRRLVLRPRQNKKDQREAGPFDAHRNRRALSSSAPAPDGHDTCRSSDRHGAGGAVRRNSCPRHRSGPSTHRRNGACRASTAKFFVLEQPWNYSLIGQKPHIPSRKGHMLRAGILKVGCLYTSDAALTSAPCEYFCARGCAGPQQNLDRNLGLRPIWKCCIRQQRSVVDPRV
jgi:hypothetical protein